MSIVCVCVFARESLYDSVRKWSNVNKIGPLFCIKFWINEMMHQKEKNSDSENFWL